MPFTLHRVYRNACLCLITNPVIVLFTLCNFSGIVIQSHCLNGFYVIHVIYNDNCQWLLVVGMTVFATLCKISLFWMADGSVRLTMACNHTACKQVVKEAFYQMTASLHAMHTHLGINSTFWPIDCTKQKLSRQRTTVQDHMQSFQPHGNMSPSPRDCANLLFKLPFILGCSAFLLTLNGKRPLKAKPPTIPLPSGDICFFTPAVGLL